MMAQSVSRPWSRYVTIAQMYMTRGVSLDYSPLIEGASFLINAYCCLDSVVVVANNSLFRFECSQKIA
jgi:hypothetical protein